MIGRIIGALVGREIGRREGNDGFKGAALGALAVGGIRRLGPLGLLLGGGYAAKRPMTGTRRARSQATATDRPLTDKAVPQRVRHDLTRCNRVRQRQACPIRPPIPTIPTS